MSIAMLSSTPAKIIYDKVSQSDPTFSYRPSHAAHHGSNHALLPSFRSSGRAILRCADENGNANALVNPPPSRYVPVLSKRRSAATLRGRERHCLKSRGNAHAHKTQAIATVRHSALSIKLENDNLFDDIDPFIDPDATPEHVSESILPSTPKTPCTQGSQPVDDAWPRTDTDLSTGSNAQSVERQIKRPRSPGPSPLAQSHDHVSMISDEEYFRYPSAGDDDVASHRYPPDSHTLVTRSLHPRFWGKKHSRVSTPLRLNLLRHRLLCAIDSLHIEAPELDSLDEDGMEYLLDLQEDLRRGLIVVPRLSRYALVDPPKLGTPCRRMKWRYGQTFPRREEDYAKAAAKLLTRQRPVTYALS